ncbi:MAG: L,D-transpeptidase [Solirubrobacteraceae bacterium]
MSTTPSPTNQRSRRARVALTLLAVLVPLVPIAIAVALTSGGTPPAASAGVGTVHLSVVTPPPAVTTPAPAHAHKHARQLPLPPGRGALVATVARSTPLRARPHGRVLARVRPKTPYGSRSTLWVARVSGRWLGVVSPQVGNNRLGWIAASAASLARVDWKLRVSLRAKRLTVLHAGRIVKRDTIAVGAPANPTPTGRFAVTDRLLTGDPSGPYGCCILALSAVAPHVIQDWTGGNRIAIHSTPETWTIGQAISHGCMRLTLAEGRWLIRHVPLGTPTVIRG